MATYTAIYEIAPNAKFFSEESFLDEIKPAVNIISTLSESFGGCKPKIEIISKAPYKARITISISAGQQKFSPSITSSILLATTLRIIWEIFTSKYTIRANNLIDWEFIVILTIYLACPFERYGLSSSPVSMSFTFILPSRNIFSFLYQEEYYQPLLSVRCSQVNASCVLMFSCVS